MLCRLRVAGSDFVQFFFFIVLVLDAIQLLVRSQFSDPISRMNFGCPHIQKGRDFNMECEGHKKKNKKQLHLPIGKPKDEIQSEQSTGSHGNGHGVARRDVEERGGASCGWSTNLSHPPFRSLELRQFLTRVPFPSRCACTQSEQTEPPQENIQDQWGEVVVRGCQRRAKPVTSPKKRVHTKNTLAP